MLRPGYDPPNRHKIANELLNNVYDSLSKLIKLELEGKTVCMALDGWSNIHNESIICVCVTDMSDIKNAVYLLDTIDTKDNSHTWDYLVQLAENTIKLCESFGCTVGSVVTDNASNMSKMRTNLAMSEGLNNKHIITYGCSAHLLNLFAHDIEAVGVKSHIKSIFKYFRNTHFFAAKYKLEGGKSLILPQDVRWNTLSDTIQCYLDNWHILYKVCDENRTACNTTIYSKVKDTDMKTTAKEYLVKLKKISITLDKVQADGCTLSEATHLWLELKRFFELEVCNDSMIEKVQKRFDMAVTEYHLLAYILDPKYRGINMNSDQMDFTLDFINLYHQEIMPEIITYQAEAYPFRDYLFKEQTVSQVQTLTWWLSLKKNISSEMLSLVTKLFTASASSAGVERIFSSYGLVHSKLRNRLGIEKSSKLVSIFKSLNKDFTYD